MAHMQLASKPKSLLGYHRLLAPSAGLKVAPICLGGMNFGTAWSGTMGECSKEMAFSLLDDYHSMGGNFVDTANMYQYGQSEEWIGEWLESRGAREQMVIATKYTAGFRQHFKDINVQSNMVGNGIKSLRSSLNASLKNLRTDYVDILYVHWWDFTAPVEEVMLALNDCVRDGKVLYLGISDTPAWIVSSANRYARDHGLRPFVVYQGRWAASFRDMEREIIPMCRAEGMGIAPWGVLGQGHIQTAEQRKKSGQDPTCRDRTMRPAEEADIRVSEVLEKIADKKGKSIQSVALAWVFHKVPYVFPIIGGRKVEHLRSNVEALSIEMSKKEMEEIDDATQFDPGFPMSFIFFGERWRTDLTASDVMLSKLVAYYDSVPMEQPIPPRTLE